MNDYCPPAGAWLAAIEFYREFGRRPFIIIPKVVDYCLDRYTKEDLSESIYHHDDSFKDKNLTELIVDLLVEVYDEWSITKTELMDVKVDRVGDGEYVITRYANNRSTIYTEEGHRVNREMEIERMNRRNDK